MNTSMNMKKTLKNDIILISCLAAAAIIAAVIIAFMSRRGSSARLEYDGKTMEIDLNKDAVYDLESNGLEIHIKVSGGKAGFINSQCPDHICEGYGMLEDENDTAVCMPAKAVLIIE